MRYWSVYCREDIWPGLWRIWELYQIVTLGWSPGGDFHMDGTGRQKRRWTEARKKLESMTPGDRVVARLPSNRIGRVGQIMEKRVRDEEWDPVVPKSPDLEDGEQGRRILVRWDFAIGPSDRNYACALPEEFRLSSGELRRTITELDRKQFERFKKALSDESNWGPAFADTFAYEGALSDLIATYPERLEAGLRPYPLAKVREQIASGKNRMDVLLVDGDGTPVVVECKQGSPSLSHIKQLQGYRQAIQKRLKTMPRGILVFGGTPNVSKTVRDAAAKSPKVELFSYRLDVTFTRCVER